MTAPQSRRPALTLGMLVVALLAAAVVVAVWWALDPATIRPQAESRLSALLGQPVAIGRMRVSLAPRPALVGSDIRVGEERREAPAVDLETVRIVPRLSSLLTRAIVIEDIYLEGFSVAVLRDREGRWRAPVGMPLEAPPPDAAPRLAIQRIHLRDGRMDLYDLDAAGELQRSTGIEAIQAELVRENGATRLTSMRARIGQATLTGEADAGADGIRFDARVEDIGDEDLPAFLALTGAGRPAPLALAAPASATVSMRMDPGTGDLAGTGSLTAPAVRLDLLRLENLEAPLAVAGRRFSLEPATFALYGGSHRGTVALDLAEAPVRWSIDSTIENLDVSQFLNALTGGEERLDGVATVGAAVRGRVGEPLDRTMQGRAEVVVVDGAVRNFPLLASLNQALRLAETDDRDTRFERLAATLAIGEGGAKTDDLLLEAADVRIPAAGRIGFDRSLELSGRAIFSQERSAEMIRSVRELTGMRNPRGEIEIPLTISGTMDNPSFAFDLRAILGKAIEDELRRRLERLVRPPG
jgi:uncharacterized protein involved in outer membrane biogenesis